MECQVNREKVEILVHSTGTLLMLLNLTCPQMEQPEADYQTAFLSLEALLLAAKHFNVSFN